MKVRGSIYGVGKQLPGDREKFWDHEEKFKGITRPKFTSHKTIDAQGVITKTVTIGQFYTTSQMEGHPAATPYLPNLRLISMTETEGGLEVEVDYGVFALVAYPYRSAGQDTSPVIYIWYPGSSVNPVGLTKTWSRHFLDNYTDVFQWGGAPSYSTFDWRSITQRECTSIKRRTEWWKYRYYGIDNGPQDVYRNGDKWFNGEIAHVFGKTNTTLAAWTITEDDETKWVMLLVHTTHYTGTPNYFSMHRRVFAESYPNENEYDVDTEPFGWEFVQQTDTPTMSQYSSRPVRYAQSFCAVNASGTRGQWVAFDSPAKANGDPVNPLDLTFPMGRYVFEFSATGFDVEYIANEGTDVIYRSSYFESTNIVGSGVNSYTGSHPGPYVTTIHTQQSRTTTQRWTVGTVQGGGNPYPELLTAKIVTAVDYEEDLPLYLAGKVVYPSNSISYEKVVQSNSSCNEDYISYKICGGYQPVYDYIEGGGTRTGTKTTTVDGTTNPEELMTELFLGIYEGNKTDWEIGNQRGSSALLYALAEANDAAPTNNYELVGQHTLTGVRGLESRAIPSGCTGYPGTYNAVVTTSSTSTGQYTTWDRQVRGNVILADMRAGLLCIAARTVESKESYTALSGITFQRTDKEYDDKGKWVVYTESGDKTETIHEPTPVDTEAPNGTRMIPSAYPTYCSHSSSYTESTSLGDPATSVMFGIRNYLRADVVFGLDNRKYDTPKYWHHMDSSINLDVYGNVLASIHHFDEDDAEIEWTALYNKNTGVTFDSLDMSEGDGTTVDWLKKISVLGFIDPADLNFDDPGGEY